ncbi:MAG: type II toxin-antitoxin system VapC family toxin [Chitinophagales bacterium]
MKKIVFDSFALIAFFRKEAGYELVRDLLVKISNDESEGYMTTVNIGEIYYMICRKSNSKNAEEAIYALLHFPIQIIEADLKLTLEAAKLKAKYSFSFADAFAASLTINKKATLITGDKEFEALDGETNFKVKYL